MKAQRGGKSMKNREWNTLAHGRMEEPAMERWPSSRKKGIGLEWAQEKKGKEKKGLTGQPSRN